MDISEANLNEYCYLNTVKERKTIFSIFNQKRAEAVRILQEKCGFPSDKDFINALECNSIEGVDFGRRDVLRYALASTLPRLTLLFGMHLFLVKK